MDIVEFFGPVGKFQELCKPVEVVMVDVDRKQLISRSGAVVHLRWMVVHKDESPSALT